jgi:hypothetical protein
MISRTANGRRLSKYPAFLLFFATPFIDAVGYQMYVADRESAFRRELKRQWGTANNNQIAAVLNISDRVFSVSL